MGYPVARFHSEVDDEFICSICHEVMRDPLQTPCEHVFCGDCIHNWLETSASCPVDREMLTSNQLTPVCRLLRRLMSKLEVSCEFADLGCTAVVGLDALPSHVQQCNMNPDAEVNCEKGCRSKVTRKHLSEHDCVCTLLEQVSQLKLQHLEKDEQLNRNVETINSLKELLNDLHAQIRQMCIGIPKHTDSGDDDDDVHGGYAVEDPYRSHVSDTDEESHLTDVDDNLHVTDEDEDPHVTDEDEDLHVTDEDEDLHVEDEELHVTDEDLYVLEQHIQDLEDSIYDHLHVTDEDSDDADEDGDYVNITNEDLLVADALEYPQLTDAEEDRQVMDTDSNATAEDPNRQYIGVVKTTNDCLSNRRYGFITPIEGGHDLYYHNSDIRIIAGGRKWPFIQACLAESETVTFGKKFDATRGKLRVSWVADPDGHPFERRCRCSTVDRF